jgi:S1-C subfamily serine protease
VHLFGEPLTVTSVRPGGPAALKGVEVGDLLIDANGSSIPTDRPEFELRQNFAKFKRPITLGFYKMRKANEASRMQLLSLQASNETQDVRAIAVK